MNYKLKGTFYQHYLFEKGKKCCIEKFNRFYLKIMSPTLQYAHASQLMSAKRLENCSLLPAGRVLD